jgi:hypothetical protein
MSSTFFTPLIILVLFNLSSYFYTKLDELTLLLQILDKNGVGSNLQIEALRNGQTLQFTVRPEALPSQTNTNSNNS